MPYCGVHYLWFAFVCFLIRSHPHTHPWQHVCGCAKYMWMCRRGHCMGNSPHHTTGQVSAVLLRRTSKWKRWMKRKIPQSPHRRGPQCTAFLPPPPCGAPCGANSSSRAALEERREEGWEWGSEPKSLSTTNGPNQFFLLAGGEQAFAYLYFRGGGGGCTTSVRQLLGTANAQTASAATSTAPAHQPLGSANAETTPAGAQAAAADTTQRPNTAREGKNG